MLSSLAVVVSRRGGIVTKLIRRSMSSRGGCGGGCGNAGPSSSSRRPNILADSWSAISCEYERVLVPRFAPWTIDALDALRDAVVVVVDGDATGGEDGEDEGEDAVAARSPPGAKRALVLCCGPGQELLPIAKILGPNSTVLGTDLAPGMIEAAGRRIEADLLERDDGGDSASHEGRIAVEVGDATDPPPGGPYDVVFSAFGLQQLPHPMSAVATWLGSLGPGGVCVLIYWPPRPPNVSSDHPFVLWEDLVKRELGRNNDATREMEEDVAWDENIVDAIHRVGGIEIIIDEYISHDITWKDGRDMFEGMSKAGPWHAMRLKRGDDFVDMLGEVLVSRYPPHETLAHSFAARMIVARKKGLERYG